MKKEILQFSSPFVQVILIVLTCFILFFCTYRYKKVFRNNDPEPHITLFDDKTNNILQNSSPIEVGFYIRGFYKFDLINNHFLLKGVIWFIFDPNKISRDLIDKFSFFRANEMNVQVYDKEEINLADNKKLIRYFVQLDFSSNLDFSLFPLDDHRLYCILNNKMLPLEKGYFVIKPENFKSEGDIHIPGWNNVNLGMKSGYTEFIIDDKDPKKTIKFPRIVFYLDLKNDNIKDIIIIFLPLFITLFIVAFFFSISYAKHQDLITGVIATAIPAILSYRFVIDTISPRVSYFMFADYIFALFVILAFLIFIFNFYMEKIVRIKGTILISFYLILIIMWQYFLCISGGGM